MSECSNCYCGSVPDPSQLGSNSIGVNSFKNLSTTTGRIFKANITEYYAGNGIYAGTSGINFNYNGLIEIINGVLTQWSGATGYINIPSEVTSIADGVFQEAIIQVLE